MQRREIGDSMTDKNLCVYGRRHVKRKEGSPRAKM